MSRDNYRRISFRMTTAEPLPAGEQVFVSGSLPALGNWQPDGLPLTRVDDSIWSGFADIPTDIRAEFKVTRGTWESQALAEDGTEPENHVIRDGDIDLTVNQFISCWRDDVPSLATD